MTIHGLVGAGRERLRAAGIVSDEADLDARLLAQAVLGWDTARYFASGNDVAAPQIQEDYERLLQRRVAREPLAYIVGEREFWGLAFEVTPDVLIPRPETELIVESALALFPDGRRPLRVADVCTGSGCLAVALACERAGAAVVATDISKQALGVAERNARRHQVAKRIDFIHGDLLAGAKGPFDLIVANPPYVPDDVRRALAPEVRNYEPRVAIFGGFDGLAVISRLIHEAAGHLRPHGTLIFEIGIGQTDRVAELIAGTPRLTMDEVRSDLQGLPRTVIAHAG